MVFFYCIVYSDLKTVIWQKDILVDVIPSCTLLPSMEFNRAWPDPMVLVHQNRNYIRYLKRKGQLFCGRFWGWEKIILQRSINCETSLLRKVFFSSTWCKCSHYPSIFHWDYLFFHVPIYLVSYIFVSKLVEEVKPSGLRNTVLGWSCRSKKKNQTQNKIPHATDRMEVTWVSCVKIPA